MNQVENGTAIGASMIHACSLRDEAQELFETARSELLAILGLPAPNYLTTQPSPRAVRARDLADRFEASFHSPHIDCVLDALEKSLRTFVRLGDSDVAEIRPITRFRKRQYVQKGGIPLLGSKQIFQYDPIDVKKLALGAHAKDLEEIGLTAGMILITCSGTIGKVQLTPRYMDGWAANQHATRVIAKGGSSAEVLFAWLSSDYGHALIRRHSYGSVIPEVDATMIASIPVPKLLGSTFARVENLVRQGNELRTRAWEAERRALTRLSGVIKGTE